MFSNVNLNIAKVHLLSRKRQTIIAILGVMFGISMFILIVSFMKGTNEFLQDAMLSSTPDIHIYNEEKNTSSSITDDFFRNDPDRLVAINRSVTKMVGKNLQNLPAIIDDIKKDGRVLAVSPVLTAQVFFQNSSLQANGIINGVNISEETKLLKLSEKMVEGKPESLATTENGILLGNGLAEKLNASLNDMIMLSTASGSSMRFKVVGLFQFGLGSADNGLAIVNLSVLQRLLNKPENYATDIHVRLKNIKESKSLANIFENKYGYRADDWATTNQSILATVIARNFLTWVVSIAVLIVAAFGMYNIMSMNVANKVKDIAILKAKGFTGQDIGTIFLSQSTVIGFIGGLLGIAIGFLLSYLVSTIPFPKSDVVSLKYFPVTFEIKYYVFGVLFGIITTLSAGIMPSIKASKADPVAILRG